LSQVSDLPKSLRDELAERFQIQPLHIATHRTSTDNVDKLLVHGGDGEVFECVLLPYKDRVSCCLSSQVGCPMGCKFCATGLGGFDRNLSAGEIVGQYLMLQRLSNRGMLAGTSGAFIGGTNAVPRAMGHGGASSGAMGHGGASSGRRISHVVFMGMGEPLLNLPNVIKSLKLLKNEVGLSYRHMTVSTVGLVPQIYELAKEKLPIHLALSLHSAVDEVRDALMPVNHKWPVKEVMQAMRDYHDATGRKITLEYLLIKDITDTQDQARELARVARGFPLVVNLIPFNWVDTEQGFARPENERVRAFRGVLESKGINVTQRVERGHDIAAACGQLAGQHKGRFARRQLSPLPVTP